jgi:branched-chain amino acid transport system ATP-binding protein
VLEVSGLSVAYGPVLALSDVTLQAEEGSITAVLGANGAGKTTLLRALTGLAPVKEGSARWAGKELLGQKTEDIVRLGVAHVPEGRGVVTELTVDENLRLGALFRRKAPDHKASIERIYELFPPLAERRHKPAATLSGGERQMLVIGRALVAKPRLLLLDEPSLGLAPLVTLELMRTVQELTRSDGLTLLLVEQNAKSALSIADTAVVLNIGRVVMSGDPSTLAADDQLRHSYLGF